MKYLYIVTIKPISKDEEEKVCFISYNNSFTDIEEYYRSRMIIVETIEKICEVDKNSTYGPINEKSVIINEK